jgi:hypothetical protein
VEPAPFNVAEPPELVNFDVPELPEAALGEPAELELELLVEPQAETATTTDAAASTAVMRLVLKVILLIGLCREFPSRDGRRCNPRVNQR